MSDNKKDIGIYVGIMVLIGGFSAWLLNRADALAATKVEGVEQKVKIHIEAFENWNRDYQRHKDEEADNHRAVLNALEDQHKDIEEGRKDGIALYKAVMSGRPQERLEHPMLASDAGK